MNHDVVEILTRAVPTSVGGRGGGEGQRAHPSLSPELYAGTLNIFDHVQ